MEKKNIIILAVLLSACGSRPTEYPQSKSQFVIAAIRPANKMSIYLAEPIASKDLNVTSTWFCDSIGAFNAGDTISFSHTPHLSKGK